MNLTRNQLIELRKRLREAIQKAIDSGHTEISCNHPHLDSTTKESFRWEPKPKGRPEILKKYKFEIKQINNIWHVKIPLGTHGIDYLGIDPNTNKIICTHPDHAKADNAIL